MIDSSFKASLIAAALLVAGSAFAQGAQPNPNVANPATGAGQQSQQGTPMGTTGVPAATPGAAPAAGSMTQSAPPSGSMSTDATQGTRPMRTARADRN